MRQATWETYDAGFSASRAHERHGDNSFGHIAAAEPKEEVEAEAAAWAQALGEDDPDKVLPFYASDAVLWGTYRRATV